MKNWRFRVSKTDNLKARLDDAAKEIKAMDAWVKENSKRALRSPRFREEAQVLGRKFTSTVQKFAPIQNAWDDDASDSEKKALVAQAESHVFEVGSIADEFGNLDSEVEAYIGEVKG